MISILSKESLFSENESLRATVIGQQLIIRAREEKLELVESENQHLRDMLVQLRKQAYGPRGERWETEEQGKLFNEAELEAVKPLADSAEEGEAEEREVTVKAHTKKVRGKRKPLPEHLEREVVVVELPPAKRFDEAGNALKVVGKDISEKLKFEPAKLSVIEYQRLRYGVDAGEPVKTAPPVPSVIPKGIATPSLLAGVVTAKYADGLPLYRQEEIFRRLDVELSRTSMARWIVQGAGAARPVWNLLEEKLLSHPYVACDETWTQVLKEEGRKAESQSWMWVRSNPGGAQKIVLFDYDPHRSGDVAKRLFLDYEGTLQCDGYSAYNALEKKPRFIRIGCNMHGRRGFRKAADGGSAKSKPLAAVGLKFYRALYEIEEEAKKKSLSFDQRHALRAEKAKPIWDEFKAWAEATQKKVPKKSSIGEALHYFLGEYDYLIGYLQDGRLEIDNGHVERMIKNYAIGRNNWLFSDTPEGADSSALFYSLVVTAKVNGINPYRALTKLFELLPLATTANDFEHLAGLFLYTDPSP